MPDISVVTICFNNLSEVIATCASIDNQTIKPFEHIIINGSTQPEVANWLTSTPQPTYRKWENMPALKIVPSFNLGIEKCTGKYIHLLNSGDLYASPDVLEKVTSFLIGNPSANWISGNIILFRGNEWITVGCPFDKKQLFKGMRKISHPTWFVKKEVYNKYGLYAPYEIAMDYDMMCRIKDEPYAYLNYTIAKFDNTGISTLKYNDSLKQNIQVYEANFGFSAKSRVWQFRLRMLHSILQTSFGKWLFRTLNA